MIVQGVTLNGLTVFDVGYVTSGLQLYYDPGNSSSYTGGATIYDLSGRGHNGTVAGSPTDAGNWFNLTGTQYVQTPNMSTWWSGWQHTIEVWMNPSAAGVGFIDSDSTNYNGGYHATGDEFYAVGPNYINNTMFWTGAAVTRAGGGSTPLNNWYQIVRSYNGSNSATAYVNGVSAGATSITWSTPSSGWYVTCGGVCGTYYATGNAFQGKLGIMRVYDRQLSASEVLINYNGNKGKYGL